MNIPTGWNKDIKWKVVRADYTSVLASHKYSRLYTEGAVTTARRNTLGIMCFDMLKQARAFAKQMFRFGNKTYYILRVIGRSRGTRPQVLSQWAGEFTLDQFYRLECVAYSGPPEGTICYPEVLVLARKEGR